MILNTGSVSKRIITGMSPNKNVYSKYRVCIGVETGFKRGAVRYRASTLIYVLSCVYTHMFQLVIYHNHVCFKK